MPAIMRPWGASVTTRLNESASALHEIEQAIREAARYAPGLDVGSEEIVCHVERLRRAPLTRSDLATLNVRDLALAVGCSRGAREALLAFDNVYGRLVRETLRELRFNAADVEDLWQELKVRLLVAKSGMLPRIAGYSGTGPLSAWVRVSAVRFAFNRRRNSSASAEDNLASVLDTAVSLDPEMELLAERFRPVFRVAVREALDDLPARDLVLLRQTLVHGMTVRQLGLSYGLHHTSMSRRIRRIRDNITAMTKAKLASRLEVDSTELDSILRNLDSRLEASFTRLMEDSS